MTATPGSSDAAPVTPPPTGVSANGAENVEGSTDSAENEPGRFETAVIEFIDQVEDRLTPLDGPALVMLQAIAKDLDAKGLSGPLVQQYGLQYRALVKRLGTGSSEADPDEGLFEPED